ncbi:hypothetical protein SG34_020455 [Thalassomonas viridans]|uniref:EF-hand domain-containing protein n=1 Tax=Thalassomonas viridans TaxID=137584 RepID=A0AAF0C8C4_9GAMM|nr:hypothetical protein [Thalassomonas viridans]WDE03734.1 hypothetical protein SG34_020455 [Thalassomonas viridans]
MSMIKKSVNFVVIAGFITTATALSISQSIAFERGQHRDNGGFNRLDTNADGVLSLEEMTAKAETKAANMLARKDSDEDGVLTLDEFQQGRDGVIADYSDLADEIVECVADLQAENVDIVVPDADNFLSPADKFAALDTSGDSLVDGDELAAAKVAKATEKFDTLDTDENGEISEEEYQAAKESRRATKQAIRQCISEVSAEDEAV